MSHARTRLQALPCAALLGLVLAGPAFASVAIVGDTSAANCSIAALAGRADDDSLSACNDAIEHGALNQHDLVATYINRGDVLMNRRAYADALADFERASQLDPTVGEAWMDRGAIEIIQHRFADGIADTTRGITLGLKDPARAYYNRAVADEGVGDEKSAYLDYQEALALEPGWDLPRHELLRFTVTRAPATAAPPPAAPPPPRG